MSEVELDPSEVPCFYESDDHEQEYKDEQNVKEEVGKIGMYEEGSWQVLVPKPPVRKKKKEKHTVYMIFNHVE